MKTIVKRYRLLLIMIICVALFVSACGGNKDNSAEKRDISNPNKSTETVSDKDDKSIDAPVFDEGSFSSLDEIKDNAKKAGYETEEIFEMQVQFVSGFVDGFNILIDNQYELVLEFETPAAAQAYGDLINEGGYGVAIVNGRFVASVSANNGIIEDKSLQAQLEAIMEARAQIVEGWTNVEGVSEDTKDYKGAFAFANEISTSLNIKLEQSISINNLKFSEDDSQYIDGVIPLQLVSISLSLTSQFSEDEADVKAIETVMEDLGLAEFIGISDAKASRNGVNDYSIHGKVMATDESYEVHAKYDPSNGSLQMIEKTSYEVTEFYEFIPLGNKQYAFQTMKERAIVNYENAEVISYIYTKLMEGEAYDFESSSIYPNGNSANSEWASPLEEDSYAEYYKLENDIFRINVYPLWGFGDRIIAEIPAQ